MEITYYHFALNLFISGLMVLITVIIHLIGLSNLTNLISKFEWRHETNKSYHLLRKYLVLLFIVLALFAIHGIEIWFYAGLYKYILHCFADFEEALYFSTISFTSLGNGDVLLPKMFRTIGAIEGVNGVLLLGWSTAFFITVVGRLRIIEHEKYMD